MAPLDAIIDAIIAFVVKLLISGYLSGFWVWGILDLTHSVRHMQTEIAC